MKQPISTDSPAFSPLAAGAYSIAFLLMLVPTVELIATWGIPQPEVLRWRFGAAGLLSSALVTPIFGVFLAVAVGCFTQRRWVALLFSSVAGVVSLFLGVVLLAFVLDSLQLRQEVQPEMLAGYTVSTVKALLNLFIGMVVLAIISVSGFRASKLLKRTSVAENRVTGRSPLLGFSAATK